MHVGIKVDQNIKGKQIQSRMRAKGYRGYISAYNKEQPKAPTPAAQQVLKAEESKKKGFPGIVKYLCIPSKDKLAHSMDPNPITRMMKKNGQGVFIEHPGGFDWRAILEEAGGGTSRATKMPRGGYRSSDIKSLRLRFKLRTVGQLMKWAEDQLTQAGDASWYDYCFLKKANMAEIFKKQDDMSNMTVEELKKIFWKIVINTFKYFLQKNVLSLNYFYFQNANRLDREYGETPPLMLHTEPPFGDDTFEWSQIEPPYAPVWHHSGPNLRYVDRHGKRKMLIPTSLILAGFSGTCKSEAAKALFKKLGLKGYYFCNTIEELKKIFKKHFIVAIPPLNIFFKQLRNWKPFSSFNF